MMPAPRAGVHSDALGRSSCGAEETRTPDFLLAKEALYQLSYGPKSGCAAFGDAASSRASSCERASDAGWAPAGEAGSRLQRGSPDEPEWAFLDSNQRPLPYQGSALTS